MTVRVPSRWVLKAYAESMQTGGRTERGTIREYRREETKCSRTIAWEHHPRARNYGD
jgi:hypothetical protein